LNLVNFILKQLDENSGEMRMQNLRERLFDKAIALFSLIGLPAVAMGGIEVYLQGKWYVMLAYFIAYLPFPVCLLLKKHLSYTVRTCIVLTDIYVLAVLILGGVGLSGAGIVLMMTLCVLATSFQGTFAGLFAMGMSVTAILATGVSMSLKLIPVDMVAISNSTRLEAWLMAVTLFILLCGVIILCIGILQYGLERTIEELRENRDALSRSNRELTAAVQRYQVNESERLKSKSLLEAALESTADGLLIVDKDGLWTGFNKKFTTLWSIPETLALSGDDSKAIRFVLDQIKDPDDFMSRVEAIYKNPGQNSHDQIVLKDGRIIERYSNPQRFEGQIVGRVWSFRDVTQQKLAAEKLKESAEYHQRLFNESPTGMYIQDFSKVADHVDRLKAEGVQDIGAYMKENPAILDQLTKEVRITDTNTAAIKMYRADSRDSLESGFHHLIKSNDSQHFIDQVVTFTSGHDRYEGEARNLDFTGKTMEIILRKAVINRKQNGLSKVLVSVVDVTDLHRANREKQVLEKQLQQSQKMETIGTLAGGIAHDFNNILFPIIGYTDILLDELTDDQAMRSSISEIRTGALRASELVKQILTFSRRESLKLIPMKLQRIVNEAMKLIRSTIPATIQINQSIDSNCPCVNADPTQIHQIVMNLCTNAYHAMEETGGELTVSLTTVDLTEKTLQNLDMKPGRYVCLLVKDTGYGIAQDVMGRIYDPYFTTKEKGRGTGMGLSVVQGIVAGMHGVIQVESAPGKGANFRVYFPANASQTALHPDTPPTELPCGNEHIFLVDDEPGVIALEKKLLYRLGYKISTWTSSPEALSDFQRHPDIYDLVITDVAMPKLGGDRLAVEMLKIRPDIPIILCTGFSGRMDEMKAKEIGVKGFLTKPVSVKDLAETVRQVLDNETLNATHIS